ncbi:MAG: 3-phosphoserine/phosphohydroxythreonine transaminase [Candidatus Omnitrophota bacterium]
MTRIHNFSAGPAGLPLPALQKAQEELLDFKGQGMSLMEMSHRSKPFAAVIESAEANIRSLLGVPNDYAVLFLQGGASLQFAMIPMNLRAKGQSADYIHTGSWSSKAIKEAKITGAVNVVWDGKDDNYMRVPSDGELQFSPAAAYVHICSNETIGGIRYPSFPKTEAPLIADMSSEILSRAIDVKSFGLIYAGAQKNIGPSGLALLIVRKDLLERCPEDVPLFLRYKTHAAESSLYNTPNTWAIYIVQLITEWMIQMGGVAAMQKINEEKAAILYNALDSSAFWKPCAQKSSRSIMNVTWRMATEELEAKFIAEATKAGLSGLKGHRSVGGLRASIYNACAKESVEALVSFMKDFETANG